ncbi:hypothetical protein LSH36_488g06066 [Paralvinella palmiformis]|uniref:Uncharacterized protein n=1 Tax=Paralvinella palmiformis TaxID=53620 RepID=A0AAD9J9X4_9ANNE|nr:hypothetical protein LSH36_488g06066 [Paralvinella palmiformis]
MEKLVKKSFLKLATVFLLIVLLEMANYSAMIFL